MYDERSNSYVDVAVLTRVTGNKWEQDAGLDAAKCLVLLSRSITSIVDKKVWPPDMLAQVWDNGMMI
jgi:hypothetical protein